MTVKKSQIHNVPFARPDITELEKAAVLSVLDSGWLTSGPEVQSFEEQFALSVNVDHAIAVNSCTAALHLGLICAGVCENDIVLVPAITFTATAEVIAYEGAMPVILDVNRNSYLLEPDILQKYLAQCKIDNGQAFDKTTGRRIKAVIPVHLGGRPCNMDAILSIAEEYNIAVIEDAAHAFPAYYKNRPIGGIGHVTAFSFYATKNLATGEGGMFTTNNADFAQRVRRLRLHGILGQTYGRKRWFYDVVDKGYKYNMSDLVAAIGNVQLKRSGEMLEKRKNIDASYRKAFEGIKGLSLFPLVRGSSYHLFTVEIQNGMRDLFVEKMQEKGIGTSLHFIPLYRHSYYKETYKLLKQNYPASEEIFHSMVSLPIYSAMSAEDRDAVIVAVKSTMKELF